MKSLTGIFLVGLKIYASIKIFQWLYFQVFDKVNHPITEIQSILVFLVFDIWLMTSLNQIKEELKDIRV
jgi:hypothetical protein